MNSKIVIIPLLIALILLSCTDHQDTVSKIQQPASDEGVEARVTTAYLMEGCDVLLEITEDDLSTLLLPIHLDEKFRVHGSKLLIEFHSSRIKQYKCQLGRPIILDRVKFAD